MTHRTRIALLAAICACLLCAHPMGNFSVNHYARILPHAGGADITYVMDLAEIPTFELFQKWNLQATSAQSELEARAEDEARGWVRNLNVTVGSAKAQPRLGSVHMTLTDGVGGMKVMRVEMKVAVTGGSGKLEYEDRNYPERAGWKEIVVGSGPDHSQALTAYPTDPAIPQPQDLRASIDITGGTPIVAQAVKPQPAPQQPVAAPPAPTPQSEPIPTRAEPTSATPAQAESLGSLKRGDYLSTVLHGGDITFGVGLLCLIVTFGLGAMHAFEPGHGKTMVAAYLVGSRGTPRHAVALGLMTTFTHTISVFALGFVTIFLSRYIMPEKMSKVLGVISGLSIVWIGGLMLYRRARKLAAQQSHVHHHHHDHEHAHAHGHDHEHHTHDHSHDHSHDHDHEHEHAHAHGHDHEHHTHDHSQAHSHGHDHEHANAHAHGHNHEHHAHDHSQAHSHDHHHDHVHHSHDHDHGHAHPHHHMPEGDITMGSLIALGASGGLVPCPAALILLLTCISLGRPGFGMLLLLSFSVGLAVVLMATGMVVLYAKHLIPERHRNSQSPLMQMLPVLSAAIIVVVGVVMTSVSMGWLPAVRFFG